MNDLLLKSLDVLVKPHIDRSDCKIGLTSSASFRIEILREKRIDDKADGKKAATSELKHLIFQFWEK